MGERIIDNGYSDFYGRDRYTRTPRIKTAKEDYLTILDTVKSERAPLSSAFVTHLGKTDEDSLPEYSKPHLQGVTVGELISEVTRKFYESGRSKHEERVEVKEFMRGLMSAFREDLVMPLIKAVGGKQAAVKLKNLDFKNRLKALRAEMSPLLSCLEQSKRRDTEGMGKLMSGTLKNNMKHLAREINKIPIYTDSNKRRQLLAEKAIAQSAYGLMAA